MLGTLAACLRFRRPRGRGRRSALLNVGPRLAACRRLPPSRRLSPPGSFRPSSRLRFRGRARRGRGCGLTGSTHRKACRRWRQQPAKRRAQAVRSGRPHSLLSAPLRGLAAVAFSNVWKSALDSLPTIGNPLGMRSHPAACGVGIRSFPPRPCFKCRFRRVAFSSVRLCARRRAPTAARSLHPSKAVTSNTAPRNRRALRRECAPTVQTSRPFAYPAARPAGRSSRSRARHRSGWRGLAVAGVGPLALRGPASPGSLRAHPARHGETPCHAGCCALRSQEGMRTFFAPKPAGWWGLRNEKCSQPSPI